MEGSRRLNLLNDAFLQQTLPLHRHHKVVCLVLKVHNGLQVHPRVVLDQFEEVRFKDFEDAPDLINGSIRSGPMIDKVDCDADGQLTTKTFPFEL